VVNLLVKPFYVLGIDIEIQNRVGTDVYGNYFALLGFAFIFNMILDLGINNYNTKEIANDPLFLKNKFSKLLALRFLLFIAYLVVVFILGYFLGYTDYQQKLLLLLGVLQGMAMLILFLRSNLSGLLLFKKDTFISVFDRMLLIAILSYLLWGSNLDSFKIEWLIYSQMVAYGITIVIAFIFLFKYIENVSFSINKKFIASIFKQSLPYLLLTILMMMAYRLDSVMLERMLINGKRQAGIYAKGFRFFEAANMIAYLFAVLLLPIFTKMLSKKEDVSDLTILSFKILFSGAFVITVLCFVYNKELLGLRYIEHIDEAAPVFGLLMISFLFVCIAYIFGTLLTANGSLKTLNKIALATLIINVILNVILIPKYQAWGAAIASVISFSFSSILQVYFSFKKIPLKVDSRNVLNLIVFISGVIIFSYLSTIFFDFWLYNAIAFVLLSTLWIFITRMLSITKLITILKNE